ncbi:cache domain-containing sensor histidine kinase [Paenibacillus mesotrionivorans]|uniref:Sensor histidine kinase n=1 Tax=Paenibacillus mesotrionivorans TaxID=3160968 RepID=A0ACC7NXC3_9BACL
MKWISQAPFRNKLIAAFMTVTLLSILMTGYFSYSITTGILEDNALKLTQDTVAKTAQTVDEKLSKLSMVMMTFMISQQFKSMLKDVSVGNDSEYYTHWTNLDNVFTQARIAEPLIQGIFVSTPMGEFYPSSMNRNRQEDFRDTDMYKRVESQKRTVWIEGHEDPLFYGKQRVVSLVLEPIAEMTLKDVYVVVNIREDGLRKLVGPESGNSGSLRFLMNEDAALIYSESDLLVTETAKSELVGEITRSGVNGYTSFDKNGSTYLLNYARLHVNDWTILAIQSKDYVMKDMIYVKWMILFITLASFLVTLFVAGAFTRYLLTPLHKLQKVMKRVESNDLTARFESRHEDDLAQVGFRFNRMLDQIVVLIDEVKEAEAGKRSTEIKALSAQMDPHFLYNTLNVIYWKLKLKQVDQSQTMVVSLSRLFQLGLNKGKEITTLEKELEHVRLYLELQASCYENLFEYSILVKNPSLQELTVPRIILQPLVENSILHGFSSMESGGRISIELDSDPSAGCWSIRVEDNGCGMEEDAVRAMLRAEQGKGYAIGNLIQRLQLYYGGEACFHVVSHPGRGTVICINIPFKEAGSDV